MSRLVVESELAEFIAPEGPTYYRIFCEHYRRLTLLVKYSKGDEDSISITPYIVLSNVPLPELYPSMQWVPGIARSTPEFDGYLLERSMNATLLFDITGAVEMRFSVQAHGALTPTGIVQLSYVLKDDARG